MCNSPERALTEIFFGQAAFFFGQSVPASLLPPFHAGSQCTAGHSVFSRRYAAADLAEDPGARRAVDEHDIFWTKGFYNGRYIDRGGGGSYVDPAG